MTQVLVAGIAVLDCVFEVSQMPASAEKHIARDAQWVVGGCAANAAIAISRLGGSASLAVQLGDDIAASIITESLHRENIDLSCCARYAQSRSAVSSVFVDAEGERLIVNFRGDHAGVAPAPCPDPSLVPSPEACARPAGFAAPASALFSKLDRTFAPSAVLVDTRWLDGAEQALELGLALQIPRVLDAEAPVHSALLEKASHIAFSRSGLLSLELSQQLDQALLQAAEKLAAWVCVTDGANGVYSVQDGQLRHYPAYPIDAVDTLGAGDVWHGAFCLQLAKGQAEADCIRFANATAALKCMHRGGGAVTPDLAAVQAFIDANK